MLLLQVLASVLAPEQLEPPKHDRRRSDLPFPQVLVQLVQDPQFDHATTAVSVTDIKPQNTPTHAPGQVLLLHGCSSTLAPEQLDLPKQVRRLLVLPPPQLLVHIAQDPQSDQVTSAATDIRL